MDRASGAIMGALIGDALGLGCHWYYDLAELRKDYGPWIDGYTTPRPDRYPRRNECRAALPDGLDFRHAPAVRGGTWGIPRRGFYPQAR